MGLLDPFWTAVDTTIAGVGSTVGGAIAGVGDGISQTGRNVGDGIAGAAHGYGSYVNDTANYVKDATGAGGVRVSSASNPIGLAREKDAARYTGMPKYAPYKASAGDKKALTAPAPKTGPAKDSRSIASRNAANDARDRAIAAAKARAANNGAGAGAAAAPKPKPSAAAPAAKKPATAKPADTAKKTSGNVTGRAEAAKGVTGGGAKKPAAAAAGAGGGKPLAQSPAQVALAARKAAAAKKPAVKK